MNETQTPVQTQATDTTANYPVQAQVPYPATSSRLLAAATIIIFAKMILLIPHLIVLYFINLFSFVAMFAAQFYILAKGTYPVNLFALIKAMNIWQFRVNSYMFGLTDHYPPLAFDAEDSSKAMTAMKRILIAVVIFIALIIVLSLLAN